MSGLVLSNILYNSHHLLRVDLTGVKVPHPIPADRYAPGHPRDWPPLQVSFPEVAWKLCYFWVFEANLKTVFQYQYWLKANFIWTATIANALMKKKHMKMSGSISLKETFIYPSVYEVTNSGRFLLILYHTTSGKKTHTQRKQCYQRNCTIRILGIRYM